MSRWLKNTKDGTIYPWSKILSKNALCMEVSEQDAFPEKFIPESQKDRDSELSLHTDDIPVEGDQTPVALGAEAGKNLDKRGGLQDGPELIKGGVATNENRGLGFNAFFSSNR